MKDKNLLDDIKNKSLNELTEIANNIIEKLESEKDLEASINDYQELIKLNNLIEKKFQNTSRKISEETKSKINIILKILPTSTINLDLIFLPPGSKPYFIGLIRSVFFCFDKNLNKNKFVSFATLLRLFSIFFISDALYFRFYILFDIF